MNSYYYDRFSSMKWCAGMVIGSIIMSIVMILIIMVCEGRAEISESQAVRAIIGEASSEGYEGMLAVAGAIRNRGTLKGVYGLKAKHVDREPKWVWDLAWKAWRASACNDVTCGATHWENIKAFGKPRWAYSMKETYRIKNHVFYKEA